ncbi:MBL fold metallo-hydrolase [Jiangella sp. DSM 45060]|uniref:MBL fold metallo-hydrolase n=1 Tax=Jiangella sp. DSM 45060 TaxID=1798224 RepID=UPI00087B0FA7|nr:MBL fold metallo-hydrolase [Jiangella sp. DSM 45060]SDT05373.1 Glyoxylase, beta-lactamase superfamily II [Jiangella sp. DSM 45060]
MLLLTVVAPVLGTNCYVVAAAAGRECVVVDPGIGVGEQLAKVLAEHELTPVAVLVTHGHLDHTHGLTELPGLPVHLHERDAYRLADPLGSLGPQLSAQFAQFGAAWTPPSDVRTFDGAETELHLAGVGLRAIHAPGHTEGSTLYYAPADGVVLTGDVLFAGTVGRTDLPGGDDALMRATLTRLASDDELPGLTTVRPGHGPASTLDRERASNPYLRGL